MRDYTGRGKRLDVSILEPKEELKELERQITLQGLFWFLSLSILCSEEQAITSLDVSTSIFF